MKYPTLEEVNAADRVQLGRWYRFLPSPGMYAVGRPDFEERCAKEVQIIERIIERVNELGGMTAAISKAIGWGI